MIEATDNVVVELARDLARGIGDRSLRITASGETAREAAEYWRTVLTRGGLVVLDMSEAESGRSARIHLHDEVRAATSYSPTGLAVADLSRDLVGEVIGQGKSTADRYSSLVAVADALAAVLADVDA